VGQNLTGANISDSIPPYTIYISSSTTLNGVAEADPLPNVSPVEGAGMEVHATGELDGIINDGQSAEVIFQVTVE